MTVENGSSVSAVFRPLLPKPKSQVDSGESPIDKPDGASNNEALPELPNNCHDSADTTVLPLLPHPFKGGSSDSGDSDDASEAEYASVSALFTDPPDWLTKQLAVYRRNPETHIKPLCSVVAAVVLGDPLRAEEVREAVEEAAAR